MSEHFHESQAPAFLSGLAKVRNARLTNPACVEVSSGENTAQMRLAGGYLTRLFLQNPEGRKQEILHPTSELTASEPDASYPMLPVGEYDGAGAGSIARWLRYYVTHKGPNYVFMQADTMDLGLVVARNVSVGDSAFDVTTRVRNHSTRPIRTSIGEHLCVTVPEGVSVRDISVNDESFAKRLGEDAVARFERGEPQFFAECWPGKLTVEMPDAQAFNMIASPGGGRPDDYGRMGVIFWQPPDTSYLCIDPTFGYGEREVMPYNDGLVIRPGSTAALATMITTK